ncbi:hypothetical protein [Psychromicrobium lacuslunae]|uniref:PglD-related sugar-binding protein n=1 Tax=Psychromicrobium lacuslunae TaxID=1618207 RepID=UPI00069705A0|nr:hypothetical protein [Psychromicrobium lacuslunae]
MSGWLIIGASGHGKSLAAVIRGRGESVVALSDSFLMGRQEATGNDARTASLVTFANSDGSHPAYYADDDQALLYALEHSLNIALGIGDNTVRTRLAEKILARTELRPLCSALIASSATVDQHAEVAALGQVLEHAHVGPAASLGQAVIVNTGAIVEHDAVVGAGSHLAPASVLLGAARLGSQVLLGSGARVLPGVAIGDSANLGAGAVAVHELPGMTTYIGVPARPMNHRKASL